MADERPEECRVDLIRVNFEKMEDVEPSPTIEKRIRNRFEEIARPVLNRELSVIGDTAIRSVWDYDIEHSCGNTPMYDEKNEEYYCPICERQSIFNY